MDYSGIKKNRQDSILDSKKRCWDSKRILKKSSGIPKIKERITKICVKDSKRIPKKESRDSKDSREDSKISCGGFQLDSIKLLEGFHLDYTKKKNEVGGWITLDSKKKG